MSFHPGGSKSISNRVLLIDRISGTGSRITGLSDAQDTRTMQWLLRQSGHLFDAGPAGTCFRFMTAFLALRDGEQVLTGSQRMLQRPIGPLVDALNQLGARIEYLGEEGYPPLRIGSPNFSPRHQTIAIRGDVSSQFISALMMIAPALPGGLTIEITGPTISESYIEMTAEIMRRFGAEVRHTGRGYEISDKPYRATDFHVEPDWSSVSYPLGILAVAREGELSIPGLSADSVQGDRAIVEIAEKWGLTCDFDGIGLHASVKGSPAEKMARDFSTCPDLAPTVMAVNGALGIRGEYSGLEHLRIKESDRIEAMATNLALGGVQLSTGELQGSYVQTGVISGDSWNMATFDDHRIAMAMSIWSVKGIVDIDDPEVIEKSYPGYWDDLEGAGINISPRG